MEKIPSLFSRCVYVCTYIFRDVRKIFFVSPVFMSLASLCRYSSSLLENCNCADFMISQNCRTISARPSGTRVVKYLQQLNPRSDEYLLASCAGGTFVPFFSSAGNSIISAEELKGQLIGRRFAFSNTTRRGPASPPGTQLVTIYS